MANFFKSQGLSTPFNNIFPVPVLSSVAPGSSDVKFPLGQLWIRTSTAQVYILAQLASGSATWTLASPGASDVDTLTADAGGAISPLGGNITLAGGTNIASSGAGSTITFNLDATVVLATSMSSPIYTVAAATDLRINAVSGKDVIIKMGDAAGANKVSFVDSASVQVAAIDSNGGLTVGAFTFTGLLTALASATINTAGTALNLGSDNSGDAVNLGVGTVARAISIGSSAAAHTITIGSTTGAASLALKVGTGNFVLNGAATSTYDIGAATTTGTIIIGGSAQTGKITLGNSSGVNTVVIGDGEGATTVNIAGGATAGKSVNIAVGAVANVVTIGSISGASSISMLVGTGNFALNGAATSTYTIGGSTTIGTISIGGTAQTGALSIGVTSGVMALNLGTGTGATTVNIASGAVGAKAVNIGTGAIDNVVIIGSVTAASSISMLVGTGNFALNGAATSTYTIGESTTIGSISIGGTAQSGTMTLAGGLAAQNVNIANSTGGKTVNIASGAGANVVTVGSTNSTSSLVLQAGSGDITITGTVKQVDAEFIKASGDFLTFSMSPTICTAADTGGVATGTTGALNLLSCQQGFMMEQFVLGAGQTIIKPVMNANGLLISGDLTATEGFEYNLGAARTNSRCAFTIGTSAAFFLEVRLFVADLSGGDPYVIGFRKSEANNATFANYTDYAAIGLNQATSAVNVSILSELNAGGQTATNTTNVWGGDGTAVTLKVLVSAAGVTTFQIGGVAATVVPAYTFDNADVVVPFIHLVHGAVAPGAVNIVSWKCGFQA